jgi:peptidyl-prolyl cis-trans isomerase B (cyclophilin B)
MIQGGSPFGDGRGDPEFQGFDTEPSDYATHIYGAISTANTGAPRSNGQQFFIVNTDETKFLDGKHTVFGQTIDGFDVLDAVTAVETRVGDRPRNDVVIESITINTFTGGQDPTEESLKGNVGGEVVLENGDKYAVIVIRYSE